MSKSAREVAVEIVNTWLTKDLKQHQFNEVVSDAPKLLAGIQAALTAEREAAKVLLSACEALQNQVQESLDSLVAFKKAYRILENATEVLISDKWARSGNDSNQLCKNLEGDEGFDTVGSFMSRNLSGAREALRQVEELGGK